MREHRTKDAVVPRLGRLLAVLLWLVTSGAAAGGCGSTDSPVDTGTGGGEATASRGVSTQPDAGLMMAFSKSRQRDGGPAFAVHDDHGTLSFANRPHHFVGRFNSFGFSLEDRDPDPSWELSVDVDGFGCRDALNRVDADPPQGSTEQPNLVEQSFGSFTAWYLNGPLGLEQGFDVPEAPRCLADAETLTIQMTLTGLAPQLSSEGSVTLSDDVGREVLEVDHLYATDANGMPLEATLRAEDARLFVDVDARDAAFPIAIDPIWSHQAELIPDITHGDRFGTSMSIDGNTAIVGVPRDDEAAVDGGAAYVFVLNGGVWTEQAKLMADDAAPNDEFGVAVSLSIDTAIVGANQDDDAGSSSGAAYVFVRSGGTWTQQAKLTANDAAAGDSFGAKVGLDGETAVVGASQDDGNTGAAYAFLRSSGVWTQQAKLTASDAASGDLFGGSVAISGDTVAVGADRNDDAGSNAGSAYVFVRNVTVWSEQAKLVPGDAAASDFFGTAVAIDGDTLLVGAPLTDDIDTNTGSAYVFVRSGTFWSEQAELHANDASIGDQLGSSVALSGDTAIVGAPSHDGGGSNSGSAYVFVRNVTVWSQQAQLFSSDTAAGDQFARTLALDGDRAFVGVPDDDNEGGTAAGAAYALLRSGSVWTETDKINGNGAAAGDAIGTAVSIDGDTAVVGAPDDEHAGFFSGAAYVFVRTGQLWTEQAKLTATDASAFSQFGEAVSLHGDTALIGAPLDDANGDDAGAAYVFVRVGTVWSEQAKLTSSDLAVGDGLGSSVSLSLDTAVVGARYEDDAGSEAGAAYVFLRSGTTWSEEAKLIASDTVADDELGGAVSIEGDRAVVGASRDDDAGLDSGAAYVFLRNGTTWSEEAKLTASDAAAGDRFGEAVSITADRVLVGAPMDQIASVSTGSAYVFLRNGALWSEEAKLVANDGLSGDGFGSSVALSTELAVIGAPFADPAGASLAGAAYTFSRNASVWTDDEKFVAPGGVAVDYFGIAVAVSADTVLIGRPGADALNTPDRGSGHVFILDDFPNGFSCTMDADCISGFCRDGVCCDTPCGGDVATDCESCLASETGEPSDGTCGTVLAAISHVCRAGSGDSCDPDEVCDGLGPSCPTDVVASASTTCRSGSGDACDPDETCTGVPGAPCPSDVVAGSTTVCRAGSGDLCDPDEACTGTPGVPCPPDVVASSSTVCNAGSGDVCDPDETCSGTVGQPCPADVVTAAGTVCRNSADLCDAAETCTGVADAACPPDFPHPAGFTCRPAADSCDVAEQCTGSSIACPPDDVLTDGMVGSPSCNPYLCDGTTTSCPTSCLDNTDCAPGAVCTAGACVASLGQGEPCSSDVVCLSGMCVDGFCCDTLCDQLCQACAAALTGGIDGTCAPVTAATDPDAECTAGSCDGTGACALELGASCNAGTECLSGTCVDGLCCNAACTGACEACNLSGSEGTCTPIAAGTECRAATGECDLVETCDGTASTCPPDATESDGTPCNQGAGVCSDGTCEPSGQGGSGQGGSGDGGASTGGANATGGTDGPEPPPTNSTFADEDGCGCEVVGDSKSDHSGWWMLAALSLAMRRRRRSTPRPPHSLRLICSADAPTDLDARYVHPPRRRRLAHRLRL